MTPSTVSMFPVFRRVTSICIFVLLAAMAACTSSPASPTPAAATSAASAPTPEIPLTTPQSPSAQSSQAPTPLPDTPITLTMWLPTRFTPAADNASYQVLRRQLDEFAQTGGGRPVQITIKQDHGAGGLLDLLRSASPVAPGALPDLIALDSSELGTAARAGLLQPLGAQLPADLVNDLFPFARDLGSFNGETYGVLYSADVEHLATSDTAPLPQNWNDLWDTPRRYLFPLGNATTGVSDAVLSHYFSAGGTLTDANGNPALDEAAVRTLLETYLEARDRSILPVNFAELDTPDKVWNLWRGTGTAVADVTATRYLSVETRLPDLHVGALPTIIRPAKSIGRGWALGVVTKDPRRQAAALKLLQDLLTPENNGAWTRAAGVLPGRAASFKLWDGDEPYPAFIGEQLAQAQPAPPDTLLSVTGPALRKAIEDVLAGRYTPAEAAHLAVQTVNAGKK